MSRVYNDEDNEPMSEFEFHNPTVYLNEHEARMYEKYGEPEKKEKQANWCWNCLNFDWNHEACTLNWNNYDESYYNPDADDRKLTDICEWHDPDPDADPECLVMGGNEP